MCYLESPSARKIRLSEGRVELVRTMPSVSILSKSHKSNQISQIHIRRTSKANGFLLETTIHNIITTKSTKKSLGALNQVDSYMPPLRGCQKTLVGWRHENKFSFLHLTRVFLNNLRMFNIYQPDSFLLAFLGRIMATDFEDYKDCRR